MDGIVSVIITDLSDPLPAKDCGLYLQVNDHCDIASLNIYCCSGGTNRNHTLRVVVQNDKD